MARGRGLVAYQKSTPVSPDWSHTGETGQKEGPSNQREDAKKRAREERKKEKLLRREAGISQARGG